LADLTTSDSGYFFTAAKIVGAFILVLAVLLLFLKLLGRLNRGRAVRGGKDFALQGTMALDSRRYLAAVEVDGRLLIIGVTHDRISPLAHWPLASSQEKEEGGAPVGNLDLEEPADDDYDLKAPAVFAKKRDKPVPRPGVREPAFYRGALEEEEEGFTLGIDEEEDFAGPQANDDFRGGPPEKK
jgi:flagellar biogenesis protein FliO